MENFNSKLQSKEMDYFFNAILQLENMEECYRFFEDVATINEIKSLAQRLQVAKMLKYKRTYNEIAEVTGASTATISRVNRALNYGTDGYNIVLERLKEK
ncbi:Trp operon repressor family [Clostridium cavendishii DSM 21758]|uniref:Trp operon repressor family n=1 Tax=Clostridium cavendishii DSM 21758 TaxID=1121302 RepID=A0A1M6LWY4_9CLOT|nr:YerC/YecD family TrpR-related protein [Clostridium cavendishii]SHJ75708.1 Trp operon repressor family [Clostridium cavendishii DSM 21758]